ncbi:MAG: AzlD domain-containing protein [Massiliimalia sp.]|jgi:branched-subunit amino acid transport protein
MELQLSRVLICILIMALVTYLPRMLPLAIFKRKIENPFIRSFLAYVPYAVLSAMTLPDILYSTSSMLSAVCGLAAALVLSYFNKGLLTVALGATATVFAVELLMRFL